ncbi:MAG: type II secretion system F family protein [Acidobacteria bacterium]|nr:type II secretion system F family protein [Acidobacteriota bacterium]
MPTYVFKGRNRVGEMMVGERAAESREMLRQILRREQVMLTSVKEKGREIAVPKIGKRGKVKAKELSIFTRQFSVMIDAGLPLVQCLEILASQQENKYFQHTLTQTRQDVEEGSTLAAAMARHPKVFDQLFTNMVEAGETGGILDLILQRLSTFIEKIVKLRRDVVSALIYPSAVIAIAVLYTLDGLTLKMPVIGQVLSKIGIARFSRTLSTLLASGVPILQSLEITAKTAGNTRIEEAVLKIRTGVERGESFVDPLKATDIFPNMVAQMVGIGEQTGALDSMLGKIADFYEQEVDSAIANLLTLMEPLMIGFLGVTIGGIVIAMYMPLFTLIGKLSAAH